MNYYYILFFALFSVFACTKSEIPADTDPHKKNIFYVDSRNGNDNNDGSSPDAAWKTLTKASEHTFKSGSRLLLKRGERFAGTLLFKSEGTDDPVVIGAWPENDTLSPLPVIDAKGYLAGIQITNAGNLEISNIEIVSDAGVPQEDVALKKRYGIKIMASGGYVSKNIKLRDLNIHHIFSSKNIPGGGQNPTSNTGMGIYISSDGTSSFKDILIESCSIGMTGHTAIKVRSAATDTSLYVHDLKILNNRLKDIGGPGIQPGKCINVLVKGNVTDHTGSLADPRMHGRGSGIWPWHCNNVLIEHNSFMYAHGKMDSHGAHIDHHCHDVVIQYNMSIENGGGFVEILGDNHNCSYRYNISINDGWRKKGVDGAARDGEILFISNYTGKNVEKKGPYNCYVYNNTIYVRDDILTGFYLANTTKGLLVANNIFCIEGETHTTVRKGSSVPGETPQNVFFVNNLYKKTGTLPDDFPVQDSIPQFGDPGFANPGGYAREDYLPSNASIVKDRGIVISKLPGDNIGLKIGLKVKKDFFGNEITGDPDIGAVEMK